MGTGVPIEGHDLGWIITFDEHCADILLVSALCLYITAFQVVSSHYDDRRLARFFCLCIDFSFFQTVIGSEDMLAGDESTSTGPLSAPAPYPDHPEETSTAQWRKQ